jgi:hypothetical protein
MNDPKCIFVGIKREAQWFLWALAQEGIGSLLMRDRTDPRIWHIAVDRLDADGARVWLLSLRGAGDPSLCSGDRALKHEPILGQEA